MTSDDRPHLLFLCHRIPFPPNKGDKIRSYHLLRFLAERYRVHLGTFVDDSADEVYVGAIEEFVETSLLVRTRPVQRYVRALSALCSGRSITVSSYHDAAMDRWVHETAARFDVSRVLVFSSAMAQYVMNDALRRATKVMDFVDLDSDKWAQYATRKPIATAWIYRREARKLETFEARAANTGHACTFVSEAEADLFRLAAPDCSASIGAVPNGVDTAYFAPSEGVVSPYPADRRAVVFTGVMDYWANVDAVTWFVREVLPGIRRRFPSAQFYIVGMKPSGTVQQLASRDVVVTGAVDDVRPYLQYADVVVAPMRVARGIQNKVLEGMAMGRTVVTTEKGLEGLHAEAGREILVADTPEAFSDHVCHALSEPAAGLGRAARSRVVYSYGWDASLQKVHDYLESVNS